MKRSRARGLEGLTFFARKLFMGLTFWTWTMCKAKMFLNSACSLSSIPLTFHRHDAIFSKF